MTWARTPDEERLLLRSLARLSESGLPIAVADRGTSPGFTESLRALNRIQVVVPHESGLVRQVQASFRAAAHFDTPYLLYVEPDKEEFFAARLFRFIELAPADEHTGVVIAARSAAAFATFPRVQRFTEGAFNDLCAEVIATPGDYLYGPFLMQRALLRHVQQLDGSLGWGWRPATFVAARRQGLRLVHLVDEHTCPTDQRKEDDVERAHRIRQLSQNLLGLIA